MLPLAEESDLKQLYTKVRKTMQGIHNEKLHVRELEKIAKDCNTAGRLSTPTESGIPVNTVSKQFSFKMMMWLVTFYDFYDKGVSSPILCNFIGGEEFVQCAQLEEGEIRLIQCFLDPRLMRKVDEHPNPLRDDEVVLELAPGGGHRPRRRGGSKMVDPLYQLFVPNNPKYIDQSDVDLRYALANTVAMVLGCRPSSNHLWYHLFDQEPLWGTYLTGFMYDNKINKDGLLYDCGVELTSEGEFGRQDYMKHANRGTYTLHSLYLLLWANFGTFCMALLTQPDSDRTIHGPIISEWLSVRHYCVSQLRTLWMHMRNNLGISEEERSFLVMRCMKRFYELLNYDSSHPESHRGVFTTKDQLDGYERMWHSCVYKPSRSELSKKFTEYSGLSQHQVFVDLRCLEIHYPYFPSEKDFTHSVLSSGDISRQSEGEDFHLLSRFALQWPRLQAGGVLLPDLVEFYQWLHSSLAHIVSYETASNVSIGAVIQHAVRRYSPDMAQHLRALYERIKVGYNQYVELIGGAIGVGACAAQRRGNKIYTIADDIPLLHFLSDVEEEEQGNDWLYTVIADIILAHNNFVGSPRLVPSQPFRRLLPDEQATAYPQEITTANCIVPQFWKLHGINQLLQLVRSRYKGTPLPQQPRSPATPRQKPTMSFHPASLQSSPSSPMFSLLELQEDVVTTFLAGKPQILDPSSLRTPFKFRLALPSSTLHPADVINTHALTDMQEKLPVNLKAEIEVTFRKRLDYEFHKTGYHAMLETTTGLRTAAGHLLKAVMDGGPIDDEQTVSHFLLSLYGSLESEKDVLNEIGIRQLNPSQLTCLSELPLASLYCCLKLFATWMEAGTYDFSHLPYTIKAHLSTEDRSVLRAIPQNWDATLSELLEEVRNMSELLSHAEAHIIQCVGDAAQTSITDYLRELNMISDEDRLPRFIPATVLIQHYVEFRLALRRIFAEVQQRIDQEMEEEAAQEPEQWKEFVEDLWTEQLPHLRANIYMGEGDFVFDPTTGHYGFQEGAESDDELMDDLIAEQMTGRGEDDEEFAEVPEEQASSKVPQPESLGEGDKDELSQLVKKNPELKKKFLSMAQAMKEESLSLTEQAQKYAPEDVAEFLQSVGLGQYVERFVEDEMSGDLLVEADDEVLMENGVQSPFHRIKIMVLFKRHVQGANASHSIAEVIDFLKSLKLDKHAKTFQENQIDGDILTAIIAHKDVDGILTELGVKKPTERLKIKVKFKGFCSSLSLQSSKTE